jgi:ferritin
MDKIINKIQKKIDAIEKLHDKESLMCEEVKDLLEELRENQVEDNVGVDFEEEFDEEQIDEDEDK